MIKVILLNTNQQICGWRLSPVNVTRLYASKGSNCQNGTTKNSKRKMRKYQYFVTNMKYIFGRFTIWRYPYSFMHVFQNEWTTSLQHIFLGDCSRENYLYIRCPPLHCVFEQTTQRILFSFNFMVAAPFFVSTSLIFHIRMCCCDRAIRILV